MAQYERVAQYERTSVIRVLFVCWANMCRSPMAERMARHSFARDPDIRVTSAGTNAMRGAPMMANTIGVLRERGADPDGFRTTPLTAELVANADLILAAGREQRADCVALEPSALPYTFTLKQFGRLASTVDIPPPPGLTPAQRLRSLVSFVGTARGQAQPVPWQVDELDDPVGLPMPAFRRCADEIQQILDVIDAFIGPAPRSAPARPIGPRPDGNRPDGDGPAPDRPPPDRPRPRPVR